MDPDWQHPPSAGTVLVSPSPSSATSSDLQYTPDEDVVNSNSRRPPAGSLKLQTTFGKPGEGAVRDRASDDDHGFDSGEKLQRTPIRPHRSAQYSMAEEAQVVRKFDCKLVPFLALLYLLSFLDRSSMLARLR